MRTSTTIGSSSTTSTWRAFPWVIVVSFHGGVASWNVANGSIAVRCYMKLTQECRPPCVPAAQSNSGCPTRAYWHAAVEAIREATAFPAMHFDGPAAFLTGSCRSDPAHHFPLPLSQRGSRVEERRYLAGLRRLNSAVAFPAGHLSRIAPTKQASKMLALPARHRSARTLVADRSPHLRPVRCRRSQIVHSPSRWRRDEAARLRKRRSEGTIVSTCYKTRRQITLGGRR